MSNRVLFDSLLRVRAPSSLEAALNRAAEAECSTVSDFVRRVLVERLRQTGIAVIAEKATDSSEVNSEIHQ